MFSFTNKNLEGICLREITVGKDGDQEDWLQKTKELDGITPLSSWVEPVEFGTSDRSP